MTGTFERMAESSSSSTRMVGLRYLIHIHSVIYYHFGTSIWTDAEFDKASAKLVEIQQKCPAEASSHTWYGRDFFIDWTGDTGYHLPVTPHIHALAERRLMNAWRESGTLRESVDRHYDSCTVARHPANGLADHNRTEQPKGKKPKGHKKTKEPTMGKTEKNTKPAKPGKIKAPKDKAKVSPEVEEVHIPDTQEIEETEVGEAWADEAQEFVLASEANDAGLLPLLNRLITMAEKRVPLNQIEEKCSCGGEIAISDAVPEADVKRLHNAWLRRHKPCLAGAED